MFKLPEEIREGIKDYRSSLEDLMSGRTSPARFTGVRVPWGIYSQRGSKVFMSRIRIPAGMVTAGQLKAIVSAAQKYGNNILHITTRQDIQIHGVRIEDTIKVIEYLKEYDLSPRGGGGNTVRNITGCVLSGVCPEEIFVVRNHALSLAEYLLRQDTSYTLPRKFKVGFSGCAQDCVGCLVQDVGLLAQEKGDTRGFRVFVGGGMGAESMLGGLLEEFIPEDDLGYCISALKNVYYKNGDRRNRRHNRLRFFIRDAGWERFKRLYEEELKALKETEYIRLRKIDLSSPESPEEDIPPGADREFREFLEYSIHPQKQRGLLSVEVRVPRGDIRAEHLGALSDLENEFNGVEFRTSQNQNIFVCNVRRGEAYQFFLKIKEILPDFLHPSTLLDVVCCKGALTCNLGLCNSPGLTEEIEKLVKGNFIGKRVLKKVAIKISGCPNACGQHLLGLISLQGMVRRVSSRPVPFYKLSLGGRKELLNTQLAKDTRILLPAKNVPLFLRDFLAKVEQEIGEDTDICSYIEARGETVAREIAQQYSYVPPYEENRDFYRDWGKTEEFSLEGLGPGECGAGVLDMIKADLSDAKISLEKAKENSYSLQEIKKALFFIARALLVTRGSDPKDELAAFSDFSEKFIKESIVPDKFSSVREIYQTLREGLTAGEREEKFLYAKEFLETITELYRTMDSSFNFLKLGTPRVLPEQKKADHVFDLKGTPCPMNYVKAKLFLEDLNAGETVEILLDEGEPIENVPKSLQNDGHQIVAVEKQDGFYNVLVKKGN